MQTQAVYFLRCFLVLILSLYSASSVSAAAKKGSHTIRLTNIEFRPNKLKVDVGDEITFINQDKFKHDVYIVRTANPNEILVPATTLAPGSSTTVTIEEKGLFTVYCTIHGGMRGKITTTGSFDLTEEEKKRALARHVLPPIVKTGEALFWGKAQCHRCHKMGERGYGTRGPNLVDIGLRSNIRAQKLGLASGTEYLVQSILEPGAYLVEGYTNDMATVYQPPIDLNEDEIKAVVTYLQSQSGQVDEWAIDIDEDKLDTLPAWNPFIHGDATRGKTLFTDAGCPSCHTVGEKKSVSPGPDLTGIGAYRNWTWLAQSIIDPNAEIGSNWKYASVYLKPPKKSFKKEEIVNGFLRENSAEQVKVLVDNDRVEVFPGKRVIRVEVSPVSKMPTNYSEILTLQQISDLIAYLQSLKGEKIGANGSR
ncbi:MAG: hypothetical protein D6743_07685 [Calditrichaeota bacterium]|nr:MAG: hypothetical protein D6743_07685 [Calditrichota bacterium]